MNRNRQEKGITLIALVALTTLILILAPLNSYGAVQSNPNTHYRDGAKKTPTNWMWEIRSMEEENGAMGLSEQFNDDGTTKDGTPSNNIDVHMMKSTEYGAIAILSTSGYGNPNIMQESTPENTTTGNKTGVYYTTPRQLSTDKYRELVAGGSIGKIFPNMNPRYYDSYTGKNTSKSGDAMDLNWQRVIRRDWPVNNTPYLVRNCGGYFGFAGIQPSQCHGRGVAVCGSGF